MMLQNLSWVKDPFKVKERSIDCNVTKHKTLILLVSDFILQLALERLPLVKFGYIVKEEYPQLSKRGH